MEQLSDVSMSSMPAPSWLDRVKVEKAELDERIEKLAAFLASPELPSLGMTDEAIELLRAQRNAMVTYSDILAHRIRLAGGAQ